jgi:hypothetical protein
MTDVKDLLSIKYFTPIIFYTIFGILSNIGFINIYNSLNYIWNLLKIEYILLISISLNIGFMFILSNKFVISINFEKR